MLPDFLEADLNNLKRINNEIRKFYKLVYYNLTILKYLVIVLYHSSKLTEYKNNKINKVLYNSFSVPTEGAWLSLLELLLSSKFEGLNNPLKVFNKLLPKRNAERFNQVYALLITDKIDYESELTVKDFYRKIVYIKNKLISHGIVSEDKAIKLLDTLSVLTEDVLVAVNEFLCTPLFLIEENELEAGIYCEPIIGSNFEDEKNHLEQCSEDGLYLMYGKCIINTSPFLICRDGNILIYNRFDNKSKRILYNGPNEKELYIKTSSIDISEIFGLDKEALNIKPLPVQLKISRNGIHHNLPDTDYREFIGRKKELESLQNMITHKRHFISALDGIGGVGKSAIALEFCNKIFCLGQSDELYFEYIVWLSAKTTILKDGEIHYINQSFEHLEQLNDTILDVLGFSEYKRLENDYKQRIALELLSATKALVILDNLETIKKDNLSAIWDFINDIPNPSKVLLTSREFHYDVPQTLRIENLSDEDSVLFLKEYCLSIGLEYEKIKDMVHQIVQIASGLPIAIKSILGQLYLGRNFRAIKNGIEQNRDNLSKFCFEGQLRLLKEDHIKVLLLICLATEELDYDAISYMLDSLISEDILKIINQLKSLSIIKIERTINNDVYTILPLIKTYILGINKKEELIIQLKEKLSEYYQLKEQDTYDLFPIEERSIDKGSLIPRKLVDKAMKHSDVGEVEEAENCFRKALKNYPSESYVWYMYAMYLAQYPSKLSEAISILKKADEISSNYIYNKKMGDYHLKLKNYQAAIKNYKIAMQKATVEKNKDEMYYLVGKAEYERAKHIRQLIRKNDESISIDERNGAYRNTIDNFTTYINKQPSIYDGKLIKIHRMLSEAYFGLGDKTNALYCISIAIDLSDHDEIHVQYKDFIESGKRRQYLA
jgi:tetratricopeptide (TPR) repeat protein